MDFTVVMQLAGSSASEAYRIAGCGADVGASARLNPIADFTGTFALVGRAGMCALFQSKGIALGGGM